jgi:hypothetical protein
VSSISAPFCDPCHPLGSSCLSAICANFSIAKRKTSADEIMPTQLARRTAIRMDLKPPALIDRRVSGLLFLRVSGPEDFVIHDLSGASPSDRWCHGHLHKLQASRRHTFGQQAKQLVL